MAALRREIGDLTAQILAATGEGDRLERRRETLRQELRVLLVQDPEGRRMIEAELEALHREYDRIARRRVRMSLAAGQFGFGGGLEPEDVHFLRRQHDKRSKLPFLEQRIAELEDGPRGAYCGIVGYVADGPGAEAYARAILAALQG